MATTGITDIKPLRDNDPMIFAVGSGDFESVGRPSLHNSFTRFLIEKIHEHFLLSVSLWLTLSPCWYFLSSRAQYHLVQVNEAYTSSNFPRCDLPIMRKDRDVSCPGVCRATFHRDSCGAPYSAAHERLHPKAKKTCLDAHSLQFSAPLKNIRCCGIEVQHTLYGLPGNLSEIHEE